MRFKSISIENVFSYAGKKTFNFINEDQPIALIIGENGFGKTSFINAVKIALHGITRDILTIGAQTLTKEEFIMGSSTKNFSGVLNRLAKSDGAGEAKIVIELEDDDVLKVERKFLIRANYYAEQLILMDEQGASFAEGEDAQDIINSKISPTMARFFFFDGEKIQTIADFSHAEFTKMLEDVLELDIYDQMAKDAEQLIRKINKTELNPDLQEQFEVKEREHEKVLAEIDQAKEKLQYEKSVLLKDLQLQQRKLATRLRKLKNRYDEVLEEARVRYASLLEERTLLAKQFKELTLVQLPLLLNPALKARVVQDINENYRGKVHIDAEHLARKRQELLALLGKENHKVAEAFDKVFQSTVASQSVTFADPYRIEKQFDALNSHEVDLGAVLKALSDKKQALAETEMEIFELEHLRAEETKKHASDITKEKELLTTIGRQEAACEMYERRYNDLVTKEKAIKSELSKLSIAEHKNELIMTKLNTLQSVMSVSRLMKQRIKTDKRAALEKSINDKFSLLKKEGYEAKGIQLDDDFSINIYNTDGQAMDILSSSSGQKQIIATALIWGISEYIGEDIPMIIDTPLGRLDDKNQTLILSEFYPNASKQVIILPTPSELKHEGFTQLQQHIADTFILSNSGSATSIIHQAVYERFQKPVAPIQEFV